MAKRERTLGLLHNNNYEGIKRSIEGGGNELTPVTKQIDSIGGGR